jgi:anti-anti-sigma regulatory factor
MKDTRTFTNNSLEIKVTENEDSIKLTWSGKSIDREPGKFISPILLDIIKRSTDAGKRVILDFGKLAYMNSSTITPIIKVLERAKKGKNKITVTYEKSLRWQEVNFSALRIFETADQRVEIKGTAR